VRIIASANTNLAKEVTAGNLREDLVFQIERIEGGYSATEG